MAYGDGSFKVSFIYFIGGAIVVSTAQLKRFKSGARLYLRRELLDDPKFPFEDEEVLKVEIVDRKLVLSRPEWWEMLDWDEMPQVWKTLPEEIKSMVRKAGLAPKKDE
ncbi:MAG: hypothetical protein ABIJ47_08105 [Candidatus Bathyarchaeota archaeon]